MKLSRVFTHIVFFLISSSLLFSQVDSVKIAVWGDSRENADGATERIADILLHKITDWDFQIHTGDFTHDGKKEAWEKTLSYKGVKKLFYSGKFFMCTSNHDDNLATWDMYTRGVFPVNSMDSTTHFYSVDFKNAHVVFLDAYFSHPDSVSSWLEEYLKNVKKEEWLIGVWHNPCFKVTYKKPYIEKCKKWLKLLYKHGGDFVFHGHAHVYVRTKPVDPDGKVDLKKGIVHIVNGTGGANWKPPQEWTKITAFTPAERSFPVITFLVLYKDHAVVRTIDCRPNSDLKIIDETVISNRK
ncbi:MAG: hypothetical protein DRP91_07965 [Candidatus Neomarinimicrobiota bacterium]|nr:MAG: hypothetical protein DRP91_07965 [Candidatus Neomarinimicrobiota bacterium]